VIKRLFSWILHHSISCLLADVGERQPMISVFILSLHWKQNRNVKIQAKLWSFDKNSSLTIQCICVYHLLMKVHQLDLKSSLLTKSLYVLLFSKTRRKVIYRTLTCNTRSPVNILDQFFNDVNSFSTYIIYFTRRT